jgi:hypothetical protein
MQFVLVSFTLSVREGDLPSEYLEASLDVLRRYAAGAFSETRHMVTEGGETSLWAAASLERGMTANRLHVQGAALVRYSLEIVAGWNTVVVNCVKCLCMFVHMCYQSVQMYPQVCTKWCTTSVYAHSPQPLVQYYMVLTATTAADLAAIFRRELNVPAKQGYNLVVKVHSRDFQTSVMKVTADALLGYLLKDELKKHFRYVFVMLLHVLNMLRLFCVCKNVFFSPVV